MKYSRLISSLGFALLLLTIIVGSALADNWPTGSHDYQRTGYSSSDTNAYPPMQLKWGYWAINPVTDKSDTDSLDIKASPVVENNYVYIATRRSVYGLNLTNHEAISGDSTQQQAYSDNEFGNTTYTNHFADDWKYDIFSGNLKDSPWSIVAAPTANDGFIYVAGNNTDGSCKLWALYGNPADPNDATKVNPNGELLWSYTGAASKIVSSPITASITMQDSSGNDYEGTIVTVSDSLGVVHAFDERGNKTNKLAKEVWNWTCPIAGEKPVGDLLLANIPIGISKTDANAVDTMPAIIVTTEHHLWMVSPGDFNYTYANGDKLKWKEGETIHAPGMAADTPIVSLTSATFFEQSPLYTTVLVDPTLEDTADDTTTIAAKYYMPLLYLTEHTDSKPASGTSCKLNAYAAWDYRIDYSTGLIKTTAGSKFWSVDVRDKAGTVTDTRAGLGLGMSHDYKPSENIDHDVPVIFVGTEAGTVNGYEALTGNTTWDPIPLKISATDTNTYPVTAAPSASPTEVYVPTEPGRTFMIDIYSGEISSYFSSVATDTTGTTLFACNTPVAISDDWVYTVDASGWLYAWEHYYGSGTVTNPTVWYPGVTPPGVPPIISSGDNPDIFLMDPSLTRGKTYSDILTKFETYKVSDTAKEDPVFEWGDTVWIGVNNITLGTKRALGLAIGNNRITKPIPTESSTKAVVGFVLNPFIRKTRDSQMSQAFLTPGPSKDASSNYLRYAYLTNNISIKTSPFALANPLALVGSFSDVCADEWDNSSATNVVPRVPKGGKSDLGIPDLKTYSTDQSFFFTNDVIANGNPMPESGNTDKSYPVYVALGDNLPGQMTKVNPWTSASGAAPSGGNTWVWNGAANLGIVDRSNLYSIQNNKGLVVGARLGRIRVDTASLQRARSWSDVGKRGWPINYMDSSYPTADTEADYPGIPASSVHVTQVSSGVDATAGTVTVANAGDYTNTSSPTKMTINPTKNTYKDDWCFRVTVNVPTYQPADPSYNASSPGTKWKIDLQNRNNTFGYMTMIPDSREPENQDWLGAKYYSDYNPKTGTSTTKTGEQANMIRVYIDSNENGKYDSGEAYRSFMVQTGVAIDKQISIGPGNQIIDLSKRPQGFDPVATQPGTQFAQFTLQNGSNVNLKHIRVDKDYFPFFSQNVETYDPKYTNSLVPYNTILPKFITSTIDLMDGYRTDTDAAGGGTFSKKPDAGSISPTPVKTMDPANHSSFINPAVSVAIPRGTSIGTYQRNLIAYVDEPVNADAKAGVPNHKMDVKILNGMIAPLEAYTQQTGTMTVRVINSRLTDGNTFDLPQAELTDLVGSALDTSPAAFINSKGLNVYWTRTPGNSRSSRIFYTTLNSASLGLPMPLGGSATGWSSPTAFPTQTVYDQYGTDKLLYSAFSAPSIISDPYSASAGTLLVFQGEALVTTPDGGNVTISNIFSSTIGSDGIPGPPRIVGLTNQSAFYTGLIQRGPRGMIPADGGDPWVFWYAGTGSNWQIYSAQADVDKGAIQVEVPKSMAFAMDPCPVQRTFSDGNHGFSLIYTGKTSHDSNSCLYLSEYTINNDKTISIRQLPERTEWMERNGANRALFYSKGVGWNTGSYDFTIKINRGSGWETYSAGSSSGIYDSTTGRVRFNISGLGAVLLNPGEGSILLPYGSYEEQVNVTYTPQALRLTSGILPQSSPCVVLDKSTDTGGLPNTIPAFRIWVFYKEGGSSSRICYKTLRLGVSTGVKFGLSSDGTPNVTADKSPYVAQPNRGQVYFTENQEGLATNIQYTDINNNSGRMNGLISWVDESDDRYIETEAATGIGDGTVSAAQDLNDHRFWVLWSSIRQSTPVSTESGTSDIYYQVISPLLRPLVAR